MALTRRRMQDLVDEVRQDLDEPYAPAPDTTNFWSQDYIVGQINRGLRQIWQVARNDKGSQWFVRRLRSTDPAVTIYGAPYNPASFRAIVNATSLTLPPDLGELVHLEPLLNTTTNQAADVRFRYEAGLNGQQYRELSRIATVGLAEYWGAVVQRLEGPQFVFQPPFQTTASCDLELEYIVKPDNYALTDTFEGLGFDDLMLDAVEAYAALHCLDKSDQPNPQKVQRLMAKWTEAKDLVIESVGPMQTVEHEMVDGFLPDDGRY